MINPVAIVGLGLLLGMRHATDADHVVAVTTIISRERSIKQAGVIGMAWGAGHTLTILIVGLVMIAFRVVLPPRLGLAMELAVGIMLVLLGLRNMGGAFRSAASENRDAGEHGHSHTALDRMDRWFGRLSAYQLLRPFVVGIVHGMAGSAAIALLVLSTIQSVEWAAAYLLIFGLGTMAGMMLITMTMASAFTYGQKRLGGIGRHVGFVTGVLSLAVGLFLSYQIAFVNGLFTAHASWTPR
jgi:high-affinity nickel permease